jgi:hypothetical protein
MTNEEKVKKLVEWIDPEERVAVHFFIWSSGQNGAAPSVPKQGTEIIYKIDSKSFRGADHLRRILEESQTIVDQALAASPQQPGIPSES